MKKIGRRAGILILAAIGIVAVCVLALRAFEMRGLGERHRPTNMHVSHEGYDRIVVVSHSQGTVISAELLRYMKERAAVSGAADPVGDLWRRIEGKVSLVTAGCPLRQLYAARFPVMYDWVLGSPPQGGMGPTAADVGVNVWVNLYATGDYVGRWLWSRGPAEDGSDVSCPQIDDGKYSPDLVVPTALPALLTERDICLGAGAHTHYFDKDNGKVAQKVASVVDALVAR